MANILRHQYQNIYFYFTQIIYLFTVHSKLALEQAGQNACAASSASLRLLLRYPSATENFPLTWSGIIELLGTKQVI